ncbi:cysteinyl-tRNA synthetase [Neorhizobium sp. JUb45]|nr:cysteine--tRNA ligase [Neorhizobium sp. JUb45]TCQ99161.1 cysteinyl-tRNA synthetase [Neorhizobium sp. JUb45]
MPRRPIYLFNTMSRSTEPFVSMSEDRVGVYTCGPTVYNNAHLGNMRTYIFSDTLVRLLRANEFIVNHVMNITDVGHLTSDADEGEDKMELGAAREGRTAWQIAETYENSFIEQCELLNIVSPNTLCRATEHIPQQIRMVEQLEANGFTYRTEDGIYFDTTLVADYGRLARLDKDGLRSVMRVAAAEKRNKTDFALWKFSRADENRQMEWPSPWGVGFPGWHIECSAMSTFYLGDQFDIHTGGIDHIPVHHSNEIAQSENATGCAPFVRYWMHGNFLQMENDERMAKSKGTFATAFSVVERGMDPLAYRFLCMKSHYRNTMKFSWEILESANVAFRRLKQTIADIQIQANSQTGAVSKSDKGHSYEEKISDAFNNDLGTPAALTLLQSALNDEQLHPNAKLQIVETFDHIAGLKLMEAANMLSYAPFSAPSEIQELAELRQDARLRRDWKTADELRSRLSEEGYIVEDTPEGFKLSARDKVQ